MSAGCFGACACRTHSASPGRRTGLADVLELVAQEDLLLHAAEERLRGGFVEAQPGPFPSGPVGTSVISPTQRASGRSAVKSRQSRSGNSETILSCRIRPFLRLIRSTASPGEGRCHRVVATVLVREGVVGVSGVDDHGSGWDRERAWGRSFVAGDRSPDWSGCVGGLA